MTGSFGSVEGILTLAEQVPGETYKHGDRIRCYVVTAKRGMRGPQIELSRSHPGLVKKLFALEVPEVASGAVEIASLAREAGHRTKMAVHTKVPGLNAKGACIGPMGARVRAVMAELHGEKIDIVDFSEDPQTYVAAALSPARVQSVTIVNAADRSARVVVPDYQLQPGRRAIGVVVTPVLPAESAHGPALSEDRTDGVVPEDDAIGDVVTAHHQPVTVGGPPRGEHLVSDDRAVEMGLADPDRRRAQSGSDRQPGHGELAPQVGGRCVDGPVGEGGRDEGGGR